VYAEAQRISFKQYTNKLVQFLVFGFFLTYAPSQQASIHDKLHQGLEYVKDAYLFRSYDFGIFSL